MRFNRKGMVFVITTAVLIVLVVMPMLFIRMSAKKNQFERTLGQTQLDLIDIYQKSEKDLFYVDQAAKYASYESIFALAENGGFTLFGSKCGKYLDYNLWNKNEYCFPDYTNNFKAYFSTNFNPYLSSNDLSLINYDILLQKDKIIGTAADNFVYTFKDGNYSIKPSFSLNIGYDIDYYVQLRNDAEKLVEKCKRNVNITQCISDNKPNSWRIGSCEGDKANDGKNFRFCVKGDMYPFYEGRIIADKELNYKFALNFE
jgi:hypothetical protein